MADYSTQIDAEIWGFIEKTASFYPPETATFTIEQQRRIYDEMCAGFDAGRPEGVTAQDRSYGDVPCRHYSAGGGPSVVIYFHGGGFVVGGLDSHDDVCAELCTASGCDVVSVDYRLAPEHSHPAAYNDAMQASRSVQDALSLPLVLCGDSAGGNLAAAVAHMARGTELELRGQVLIYPGLGGDLTKGSYLEHAEAPMLTLQEVLFYKDIRLDGQEPQHDPSYAPLQDRNFTGLPPSVLFAAECDPLCDDVTAYAEALRNAGVQVQARIETGLVHGYLRARHSSARAQASFTRICRAVTELAQG